MQHELSKPRCLLLLWNVSSSYHTHSSGQPYIYILAIVSVIPNQPRTLRKCQHRPTPIAPVYALILNRSILLRWDFRPSSRYWVPTSSIWRRLISWGHISGIHFNNISLCVSNSNAPLWSRLCLRTTNWVGSRRKYVHGGGSAKLCIP